MSSSGTGLGADLQGAKPEAGQYGMREKDRIEKCGFCSCLFSEPFLLKDSPSFF